MKRDGRMYDRKTQEAMRLMAVQRMREGEPVAVVMAGYGLCRTTGYKWLARTRGRGLKALAARHGSGRPRKLTPAQERQVFRWINGKNPTQYGFDFGLWTRRIVRELIAQRCGVSLSLASVGTLLARLDLTVQKPLARWQRETYPALARQARREGAEIYFWDESGFRADHVQGKTWAKKGHTPVISVPGQRQSISAASALSSKGAFWFATYPGGLNGELFVRLLKKLMYRRRKPLHLVLDNLPAHKSRVLKAYVAATRGKLTLHYLPGTHKSVI